jgi:hypothetical protein
VEHARERARSELQPGDLEGTRVAGILGAILDLADRGEEVSYHGVFGALEGDEDRDLLARIAFRDEPEGSAEEVGECVRSLRRQRLLRERRELQRRIQAAADTAAVDALLHRTQELARQIDALI